MEERDGAWYVHMTALCHAGKDICDRLIEDFKELNSQMQRFIEQRHGQQPNNSFKGKPLRGSP
jgi:predicted GH43/DUF377 family glycosyl hydrolase